MSQRDFKAQLRRQLGFIRRSAAAWDSGCHDEAIRIATAIRVLIHDKGHSSTSLLTHLGAKKIRLLSTRNPIPLETFPENARGTMLLMGGGMLAFDVVMNTREVYPSLHRARSREELTAEEWWKQPVTGALARILSRRDLVLSASNKDGGAHVDAVLDAGYEDIVSLVFHRAPPNPDGPKPRHDLHLLVIRQFAYELMNSPALMALEAD